MEQQRWVVIEFTDNNELAAKFSPVAKRIRGLGMLVIISGINSDYTPLENHLSEMIVELSELWVNSAVEPRNQRWPTPGKRAKYRGKRK